MSPRSQHLRRGMTLIELLVVVAILGVIAVTVLPNLSNSAESRRGREAARMVSSFVSKAQSRAVGRSEAAGFMARPVDASTGGALELYLADTPGVYRGDTVPATVRITGSTTTTRTVSSPTALASLLTIGGTSDDLIRFDGRGPYFQIASPPTATAIEFEFRGHASGANEDAGYQPHNTPWPPAGVPMSFEVFRQPVPAGSPLALAGGVAIDILWSGMQVNGTTFDRFVKVFGAVERPALQIACMFDGTGRLRQIVERLPDVVTVPTTTVSIQRAAVVGPVFFLVGRADRVGQSPVMPLAQGDDGIGANWQYPDSFWIGIDPLSGVVKLAECTPSAADVVASQAYVRQAMLTDGR